MPDVSDTTRQSLSRAFDSRLVYMKTPAGVAEIAERKLGLSPAARRILIVIDGERRLSDLPAFARPGDLGGLIEELESRGLVSLAGIADDPDDTERLAQSQRDRDALLALKKSLTGVFVAELGAGGQVLEARIGDCVSLEVLKRVLREGIDTVSARGGEEAARRVITLVRPILGARPER